jgi:hypothetical protein
MTETLREVMISLDRVLTGKDEDAAAHMARHQDGFFTDPTRFLESDGYYLSDGGYSRVFYDPESERFRLSSVSRDAVKARWREADAQAIVAQASELVTAVLYRRDGLGPREPG